MINEKINLNIVLSTGAASLSFIVSSEPSQNDIASKYSLFSTLESISINDFEGIDRLKIEALSLESINEVAAGLEEINLQNEYFL